MSEFYNAGECIEGGACDLFTRKHNVYSCLQSHPLTGKPCIRIEMSRNASAEITREADLGQEALLQRAERGVHLSIGDKLKADSISVHVSQLRPVRFIVKEGATHTHGGHFASTNKNTFCIIRYAFEHIQKIEMKNFSQKSIDSQL